MMMMVNNYEIKKQSRNCNEKIEEFLSKKEISTSYF